MNLALIAISWSLLAQASESPAHQPRFEKRAAAAAPFDTGQAPPATEPQGVPDAGPPTDGGPRPKFSPPELLAEALTPRDGAIAGKPLTLLAALSRGAERQQHLRIAQAYWRLCTAQADYHWALDQRDKLGHYTHEHTNEPGTLSARASARADVRDMQLAVAQAQQELLDLMGAQSDEDPPWTTDRPHVGGYDTRYEQIFATRLPPPRIRLIHRTMPVLRKAIDDHGEAISETLDALESTGEDFRSSGQGLATVLATLEQLKHERRAFMADVRDYNQQIAEYVCAVLPQGADQATLVSKLIVAQPANGNTTKPPGRARTSLRQATPEDEEPSSVARQASASEPLAPVEPPPVAAADEHELGMYPGLQAVDPAERVQKLADLLHWDRNLPADAGSPTSLADCLRPMAPQQRFGVIVQYWRTREQLARYQVLNEQWEQLNALRSIALGLRDQPGMTGAYVRLQAARRSVHAAVLDAHAAMLDAEYALTMAAGRSMDAVWLLPSTTPESGARETATESPLRDVKLWAEAMHLAHENLEDGTEAILQADAERATLVNETRSGATSSADPSGGVSDEPMRLDGAVRAVARQTSQTLAMLRDLTDYNVAIARYVLATSPETVAPDELIRKLVTTRDANRET